MAFQANHTLVEHDHGDSPLASDESPHGEPPKVRTLRVFSDEVPAALHLHMCRDACEMREGYRHPTRFAPTGDVDDAVERTETFHASAGRADDEDRGLTRVEIVKEGIAFRRPQEVNATHDVKVWTSFVSTSHEQGASATSTTTEFSNIMEPLPLR